MSKPRVRRGRRKSRSRQPFPQFLRQPRSRHHRAVVRVRQKRSAVRRRRRTREGSVPRLTRPAARRNRGDSGVPTTCRHVVSIPALPRMRRADRRRSVALRASRGKPAAQATRTARPATNAMGTAACRTGDFHVVTSCQRERAREHDQCHAFSRVAEATPRTCKPGART